jgi:hypothetical protein
VTTKLSARERREVWVPATMSVVRRERDAGIEVDDGE